MRSPSMGEMMWMEAAPVIRLSVPVDTPAIVPGSAMNTTVSPFASPMMGTGS